MPRRQNKSVVRGEPVTVLVDGQEVMAHGGESVATVLLASGISVFNRTRKGRPRGPFCNMGTCFECQVLIARPGSSRFEWRRACLQQVQPAMKIRTGELISSADFSGN